MKSLRKARNDFNNKTEYWYDLFDDWELIEASFAAQYNIRLINEENMSWPEFCALLSGIMPDTPLGQIVSIRSEKDPKIIKGFNKEQKKIRSDWQKRKSKQRKMDKGTYAKYWASFQEMAKAAFSK